MLAGIRRAKMRNSNLRCQGLWEWFRSSLCLINNQNCQVGTWQNIVNPSTKLKWDVFMSRSCLGHANCQCSILLQDNWVLAQPHNVFAIFRTFPSMRWCLPTSAEFDEKASYILRRVYAAFMPLKIFKVKFDRASSQKPLGPSGPFYFDAQLSWQAQRFAKLEVQIS